LCYCVTEIEALSANSGRYMTASCVTTKCDHTETEK